MLNLSLNLKTIAQLWGFIGKSRKKECIYLFFLMLLGSLAEVLSIGIVIPYLGILINPEGINNFPILKGISIFFGFDNPASLALPLTVVFLFAVTIAGGIRFALIWATSNVAFLTGVDISSEIYKRTLYQPYQIHLSRNSGVIINAISHKASACIENGVIPFLNLFTSIFIIISISTVMLMVDWRATVFAIVLFSSAYLVILRIFRSAIKEYGKQISYESNNVVRLIQEGLGSIRDIILDGSQNIYCDLFRAANLRWRLSQSRANIIASTPRHGIEIFGIALIVILSYFISKTSGGITGSIPVIGALILGAQRLLPSLQQAYAALVLMQNGHESLKEIIELLNQKLPDYAGQVRDITFPFNDSLCLEGVSFRYGRGENFLLDKINLNISKGDRVGIVGVTGSGKSTLIDIIMGLLDPTEGKLKIDGLEISAANCHLWQKNIAHVPQTVFLADSTILENIAFGTPFEEINFERVYMAARKSKLSDLIENLPEKYLTLVGERGVRISGGQRQRIGIARALYKESSLIIFDEATSALDTSTESAVMTSIESLGKNMTIIIIAHRESTLQQCNKILKLANGKLESVK